MVVGVEYWLVVHPWSCIHEDIGTLRARRARALRELPSFDKRRPLDRMCCQNAHYDHSLDQSREDTKRISRPTRPVNSE